MSAPSPILVRLFGGAALGFSSVVLRTPLMLGARYSLLRCEYSYCRCTSLVHKLSMTAPSYISAHLFGCVAQTYSSLALRVSFDTWRPPLAVTVRVHLSHMHRNFVMAVEVSPGFYVSAAALMCNCVVFRASFYDRSPLHSIAVRVQLLLMHLSLL
jgi:hypothetical protein